MRKPLATLLTFVSVGTLISCSSPQALPTPTPTSATGPISTPTPALVSSAEVAISLVKSRFAEVAKIQRAASGSIGGSQNIIVFEHPDGWDIAFWQGEGDCPAGCINNRYWYFSVMQDGRVSKAGEYVRSFNSQKNEFDVSGAPMWGVPK